MIMISLPYNMTTNHFILLKVQKIGIPIGVNVRNKYLLYVMLSDALWSITMKKYVNKGTW